MTDKGKLKEIKKLADAMYYAAQYLTTDASRLHKAMDEYHQFIINEYQKEELVSEDLKEAYERYVDERMALLNPDVADMSCNRDTKMSFDVFDGSEVEAAFYEGANWHKQQMMSKAIDGVVTFDYYDSGDKTYGCVAHDSFCLEDFSLKDRDKVKVIVIKED